MQLKWTESRPAIDIPNGNHTGTIVKIERRTDPYDYTDLVIKIDNHDVEIKYGCPSKLSDKSKLGKLVLMFGVKPVLQQDVELDDVFLNKKVQLMCLKQDMYTDIVEGSLKPI